MSKEDKELDEMFHGEEKPMHPDTVHITYSKPSEDIFKKETTTTTHAEKTAQKDPHKPTHNFDGKSWEPIKERTWVDKLKDAVKWGFCFGCLSCLVFYWKEAGLMAESVAVPTIAICTALAGYGIGKNARCK